MKREEIKRQVSEVYEWDTLERRKALKEQSRKRRAKLIPLVAACASLGHEGEPSESRNIFGERFLRCKWCGTSQGVETDAS